MGKRDTDKGDITRVRIPVWLIVTLVILVCLFIIVYVQ